MDIVKVVLPQHCSVLLLEDSDMRIAWFQKRIPKLSVVKTIAEFKAYFSNHPTVDFIFLDHDLGLLDSNGNPGECGTGEDAAKFLVDTFGATGKYTLIHSWNKGGAQRMQALLPAAAVIPFGEFEVEVENG